MNKMQDDAMVSIQIDLQIIFRIKLHQAGQLEVKSGELTVMGEREKQLLVTKQFHFVEMACLYQRFNSPEQKEKSEFAVTV